MLIKTVLAEILTPAMLLLAINSCSVYSLENNRKELEMKAKYDNPVASQQEIESILLHDARVIHDTASLILDNFVVDGVQSWALANVIPGPRSGSGMIPGASVNAQTGEFVIPQGAKTVLIKEGRWNMIEATSQYKHKTEASFSWSEPMDKHKRVLLPEDFYSPFAQGGIILFRPMPEQLGIDQFGPVHLLFQEWGQYVVAASAFVKNHEQLFEADSKTGPAETNQLMAMLSNENKLIVVLAFRRLIEIERITPDLAAKQLANSKEHLRAILTYMMITDQKPSTDEPFVQVISSCLNNATNVDTIRPIALGAFSAGLLRSADAGILSRSKAVLRQTKRCLKELGTQIEKKPHLILIFKMMDTDQQNNEQ